jgi:hypothetical protein
MSHGEFICTRAAARPTVWAAACRRVHDASPLLQRQTSSLDGPGRRARFGCEENNAMIERATGAGRRVEDGRAAARRPAGKQVGVRLACLVALAFGGWSCDRGDEGTEDGRRRAAPMDWRSPRVERVRLAWEKRCATMPTTLTKFTVWIPSQLLEPFVRKEFTADEILRLAEGTPVFEEAGVSDKRDFDDAFANALTSMCCEAGHRDALVRILARWRVSYIGYSAIEYVLASYGEKGHIERGVLVLADAYTQAQSQAARRSALKALRRTFGPFGVSGKSDDEFVRNCVEWYTRNESRLKVRFVYGSQAPLPGEEDRLFILKDQQPTTDVGQ